jgi:glyoxylase I family protein
MPTRYHHTCIVARDPDRLGDFYTEVFGLVRTRPDRHLVGDWIERGTGLEGARIHGFLMRLPGHGDDGPLLEIFRLDDMLETIPSEVNRPGLRHVAFSVDDVQATLERVLAAGGQKLGDPVVATVEGVGQADFVYTRDPDGNIVELLHWHQVPPPDET